MEYCGGLECSSPLPLDPIVTSVSYISRLCGSPSSDFEKPCPTFTRCFALSFCRLVACYEDGNPALSSLVCLGSGSNGIGGFLSLLRDDMVGYVFCRVVSLSIEVNSTGYFHAVLREVRKINRKSISYISNRWTYNCMHCKKS